MVVRSASDSVGHAAMTSANLPSLMPSGLLSAPDFAPPSGKTGGFPDELELGSSPSSATCQSESLPSGYARQVFCLAASACLQRNWMTTDRLSPA
jgi:hypothetical protein